MDRKVITGRIRSGRRGLLTGLLAGTAALLGRGVDTEAGKRCRRHKCPDRTCCVCNASSLTPGCRFAPAPTATKGISATCDEACGGAGTGGESLYSPPSFHNTVACSPNTVDCLLVDCPLF